MLSYKDKKGLPSQDEMKSNCLKEKQALNGFPVEKELQKANDVLFMAKSKSKEKFMSSSSVEKCSCVITFRKHHATFILNNVKSPPENLL